MDNTTARSASPDTAAVKFIGPAPTLYIVTFDGFSDFEQRRVTGSYELDMDRMTVSNIVDDISTGQFEDVDKIYECIPGETCRDVTEEIAQAVADRFHADREPVNYDMQCWLQRVLGVTATHTLEAAE